MLAVICSRFIPRPGRMVADRNSGLVPPEVSTRFSVTTGWPLICAGSAQKTFTASATNINAAAIQMLDVNR
jgi:hypothetical protein